jgi:hypothetical protein
MVEVKLVPQPNSETPSLVNKPSLTQAIDFNTENITTGIQSLRGQEFRDSIAIQVLNRISEDAGKFYNNTERVLKTCSDWIEAHLGIGNKKAVEKAGVETKKAGLDTAAAFIPGLTPLSVGETLLQIRAAAILAHEKPELRKEARAQLLLGITDVSGAAMGVLAYSNPLALAGITLLTTGIKVGNALHNYLRPGNDIRVNTASQVAERFGIRQGLDLMLDIIYEVDKGIVNKANNLKDEFAPTAITKERALGERLLSEFHKLYSKTYPDAQVEDIDRMKAYLGKGPEIDSWDIHIVMRGEKESPDAEKSYLSRCLEKVKSYFAKDGDVDSSDQYQGMKVAGGFTCFTVQHAEFGKQLYVEQVLPLFDVDPVGNMATWAEIRAYAEKIGAKRIWLESPELEPLPKEFKKLAVFHAQPALQGKENFGPVGLDTSDPKNCLKMAVCTLDENILPPTEREYAEIITHGCTSTWANPECPAWKLLLQNPTGDVPLKFLKSSEAQSVDAVVDVPLDLSRSNEAQSVDPVVAA